MSLFGAEFLRNIKKHCGEDNDVCFSPYGYLLLASERDAERLQKNSELQRELGARNELLTKDKLKAKCVLLSFYILVLASIMCDILQVSMVECRRYCVRLLRLGERRMV